MKTLKKLSIIVAVGLSTIFFSGCSDYLDVSDDMAHSGRTGGEVLIRIIRSRQEIHRSRPVRAL
jgi:hypothetical protein